MEVELHENSACWSSNAVPHPPELETVDVVRSSTFTGTAQSAVPVNVYIQKKLQILEFRMDVNSKICSYSASIPAPRNCAIWMSTFKKQNTDDRTDFRRGRQGRRMTILSI